MSGSHSKVFSKRACPPATSSKAATWPPARGEGRLLPVPPVDRCRTSARDVPGARADGRRGRGPSPRSGERRPVRDRHQVRDAGQARRLAADPEVRRAQHGACLRQDGDVHAEAHRRRQRLGHALPPVGGRKARTCSPATATRVSRVALFYIGGIIKHAKALNAITNPGTNSYKRLVPGFEAPINLAYSARNRSAAIRIPYVSNPKAAASRCASRPTANLYLAFSAMLMAGLDGVQNKIHPGDPMDKNLYDLEPEEAAKVPHPARRSTRRSTTSTRTARSSPGRRVHQRHDRRVHHASRWRKSRASA